MMSYRELHVSMYIFFLDLEFASSFVLRVSNGINNSRLFLFSRTVSRSIHFQVVAEMPKAVKNKLTPTQSTTGFQRTDKPRDAARAARASESSSSSSTPLNAAISLVTRKPGFLDLRRELRDHIYRYALLNQRHIDHVQINTLTADKHCIHKGREINTCLLRASRQISNEVLEILYGENIGT